MKQGPWMVNHINDRSVFGWPFVEWVVYVKNPFEIQIELRQWSRIRKVPTFRGKYKIQNDKPQIEGLPFLNENCIQLMGSLPILHLTAIGESINWLHWCWWHHDGDVLRCYWYVIEDVGDRNGQICHRNLKLFSKIFSHWTSVMNISAAWNDRLQIILCKIIRIESCSWTTWEVTLHYSD